MDDPPRRRSTNTSSPARIVPNAIVRRIERRRPRARYRATAQRAIGRTQSQRAEELQDLGQVLGGLELVRLHDLDAAGVGTKLLRDLTDDRDPLPQLDHERLQIEHDGAVLGAQRADVVIEDVDQLRVRPCDGVHPELLHTWTLEHASGGPLGELAQTRRRRAGEPLLVGRQPLLQGCRDIDVRVQRVDERRRDLVADLVVGDQVAGGCRDRVRVEALEADVAGQEAQESQEHAEHGEDAGDDHLHRPFIARFDGVSITPMG